MNICLSSKDPEAIQRQALAEGLPNQTLVSRFREASTSPSASAHTVPVVVEHQFLVVERANRSWLSANPQPPTRKWVSKVDITDATDVSGLALPGGDRPEGIVAMRKTLFIDLLDSPFGLQTNDADAIAEKIEGPGARSRPPGRPPPRVHHQRQRLGPDTPDADLRVRD